MRYNPRVHIVTGLGYGDEGKGVTTKWLSLKFSDSLVIRFGGGNQVGHTVMENGMIHEHHHTGSGSTSNIDTFYSRFCTVEPIGVISEVKKLKKREFFFNLYYDPRAMLVTPLDVSNNKLDNKDSNMSVGVGFGRTIQRNEDHYHLYVNDISNEIIFRGKCLAIQEYYKSEFDIDLYYDYCLEFYNLVKVSTLKTLVNYDYWSSKIYGNLIFEGHQGVLLDMEYGIFPYVTRSKTTQKNVYTILKEEGIDPIKIDHYMVTRAYHTRHGDGPFNESDIKLINNQNETNRENPNQGRFRIGPIDLSLLKFAIGCNQTDSFILNEEKYSEYLIITCVDQIDSPKDTIREIKRIAYDNNIKSIFTNSSPESDIK